MLKKALIFGGAALLVIILMLAASGGKKAGTTADAATFSAGGADVRVEFAHRGFGGGDRLELTLLAKEIEGYVVAGTSLHVEVSGALTAAAPLEVPRQVVKKDIQLPVHPAGAVHVYLPVTLKGDKATVLVSYQTCSKAGCAAPVVAHPVNLTFH